MSNNPANVKMGQNTIKMVPLCFSNIKETIFKKRWNHCQSNKKAQYETSAGSLLLCCSHSARLTEIAWYCTKKVFYTSCRQADGTKAFYWPPVVISVTTCKTDYSITLHIFSPN